jgi:hypothetical protein
LLLVVYDVAASSILLPYWQVGDKNVIRFACPVLIAFALVGSGLPAAKDIVLTVDSERVLRDGADRFIGININYVRDNDANRPQARKLDSALKDLGVRWLRYPGGEKSNWYLWSNPPYEHPEPVSLGTYTRYAGKRMDFDQYIACARAVGAEPYVVVGYNQTRTREQWIENAVTWVKYANLVRKYGVRYWEIGNENWNNRANNAAGMAGVVADFSRGMKAVDPSIQIGSNGNGDGWWAKFLPGAAPYIDFLSLSHYNTSGWKSYDYFPQHPTVNLMAGVQTALDAIDRYAPAADRARLRVIVAETSSKDFSSPNPWPGDNTLGHAVVAFETFGRTMRDRRVLADMLWTTRWMNDDEATKSQWYALDKGNEILPIGRAVALWGQFLQEKLIGVEGGTDMVAAYASRSSDEKRISIWVVNRGYENVDGVKIEVRSSVKFRKASVHQFSGTGPNDSNPVWRQLAAAEVKGNSVKAPGCPGVSITVLSLGR